MSIELHPRPLEDIKSELTLGLIVRHSVTCKCRVKGVVWCGFPRIPLLSRVSFFVSQFSQSASLMKASRSPMPAAGNFWLCARCVWANCSLTPYQFSEIVGYFMRAQAAWNEKVLVLRFRDFWIQFPHFKTLRNKMRLILKSFIDNFLIYCNPD